MRAVNALALLLPAAAAVFVDSHNGENVQLHPEIAAAEQYLIELGPGETRWVTEDEKWELRRNGQRFMDITATRDLGAKNEFRATVNGKSRVFPANATLQDEVFPLIEHLDKASIQAHLEKLTSFHTRYYKSDYGRQSSEWLLGQIKKIVGKAGGFEHGITVEHFPHPWGQNSIITRIPGQTNRTIVVGAHQDSINLFLPSILAAPGSDDDGSGTVTILEALTALLQSEDIKSGKAPNSIEFHWYSAEEGGLLGSQAIFSAYEQAGNDVHAMLQQDMTGFVQGTLDAGKVESVGVIVDYVDPALTDFIKKVIVAYCDIPYIETKCGYACSDHASASKAGYPSAFVIESSFELSDKHIHSTDDLIKYLSFDHMLQHARLTLGFAYELAFADFDKLEKSMPEKQSIDEL
ncbi:Leucine aminopeptidase 1 [Sporothrix epigloea]|uniref:Peptide hydrolase n=1 Tax=Sporothrix epigloea TaxID=1892477 RepID=A0ABP0DQE8_9PEZI